MTGWSAYNDEQVDHGRSQLSWAATSTSADFWSRTLQNWQSEFLAVGSHRRPRDLPAPTRLAGVEAGGRPHDATGVEG